ncbi:MAG: carbon-nitrogen hydrolase family protein [Myxococcota bacterium]
MKPTLAAAVQWGAPLFDVPAALSRVEAGIAEAAARGASFIVFPEAFVGGYPKGVDFGTRVGSRSPAGREWFRRYHAAAIEVPGPETARLGNAAAAARATVAVGVVERSSREEGSGTLFCTSLVFAEDGRLAHRHRKLMPTAHERVIWGAGDGSGLRVAETEAGRVGTLICWEHFMPAARLALYGQGVELWAAPTVDDRTTWAPAMQMVAMEGRCFVVSACPFLLRRHAPADFDPIQGNSPDTPLVRGGSVIVSPLGEILAGPVRDEETILYAELDPGDIPRGKFDFDVVGHYGRPDLFELTVRTAPRKVVRAISD